MLRRVLCVSLLILGAWVAAAPSHAAEKLGKLFVKTADSDAGAPVDGHERIGGGPQFVDRSLTDTVKDIRSRHGDFVLADEEADAQYLLVILQRTTLQNGKKSVTGTVSVREGDAWKPLCKVSNGDGRLQTSWGMAARGIIGDSEKCVREMTAK